MDSNPDLSTEGAVSDEQDNWFSPKNNGFPYHKVYSPFILDENQVRLVRLLHGAPDVPIACELHSCLTLNGPRLVADVEYVAVSYCAGDPNDCVSISFSGYPFNMFRSLFMALKYLRSEDVDIVLWLDQICINQTDITERDSQVLLMKEIYNFANSTYVWLGEAIDETEAAFCYINDYLTANRDSLRQSISKFSTHTTEHENPKYRDFKGFPIALADYLESERRWLESMDPVMREAKDIALKDRGLMQAWNWIVSATTHDMYADARTGIMDILRRSWWRRSWVFQEAVASSHLVLCCGVHRLLWEDLALLSHGLGCAAILPPEAPSISLFDPLSRVMFELIAASRRSRRPYKLLTLLGVTRESQASDPRDKVYSVLGLLTREYRTIYDIAPTYSTSNTKQDLYLAVAKSIYTRERTWATFAEVSGSELEAGLPSWAPDWTKPNQQRLSEDLRSCRAGGTQFVAPMFLENDRVMKVKCLTVGLLDGVGELYNNTRESSYAILTFWLPLIDSDDSKTSSRTQLEMFFRTIHLDTWTIPGLYEPDGDPLLPAIYWKKVAQGWINDLIARRGCLNKRFFVLHNGRMGLAPPRAQPGDVVCILLGAELPLLFRPSAKGDKSYTFIGECFVTGFMHGEILQEYSNGNIIFDEMLIC